MDSFFKVIAEQFDHWIANPVATIFAFLIGGAAGFFISRLRHQGQIDALKERLKHKADQIKTKDDAIATLTAELEKLRTVTPKETPPNRYRQGAPVGRRRTTDHLPDELSRFSTDGGVDDLVPPARSEPANDQIDLNYINSMIPKTTYNFIYEPLFDVSKLITFALNGDVVQGRDENYHYWRISQDGLLELLDQNHRVYSRFIILENGRSFHHTNDPSLPSMPGQFMHAVSIIPDNPNLRG